MLFRSRCRELLGSFSRETVHVGPCGSGARMKLVTNLVLGLNRAALAEGRPPPALRWEYFATVSISVPLPSLTVTTVCNDHYFSSLQAARECHRRGYRRLGIVQRKINQVRLQGRWHAGTLVAPHMFPHLDLIAPLFVDDMDDEAAILRWLKREKPDAIISPGGEQLFELVTRRGWQIPGDIGLAWLACTRLGHRCSGVYQNAELVGATAIDTLIGLMERYERGLPTQATTLMIEGIWNEGRTLRPAPKS